MTNFITLSSAYEYNLGLAIRNELKTSLYTIFSTIVELLTFIFNQARAWFPNIDPVRTSVCVCVCVFVCVRPRGY